MPGVANYSGTLDNDPGEFLAGVGAAAADRDTAFTVPLFDGFIQPLWASGAID